MHVLVDGRAIQMQKGEEGKRADTGHACLRREKRVMHGGQFKIATFLLLFSRHFFVTPDHLEMKQ